jgi:hypothetical protein
MHGRGTAGKPMDNNEGGATMNHDLDKFIEQQFLPFHRQNVDSLIKKHPHLINIVNTILANKDNRAAIQVTHSGKVIGEYTLYLDGLFIVKVDCGRLDSQINHPFLGVVKPYVVVEQVVLEKIVADENNYLNEPFSAVGPYLPDLTIKFLN